ncbi:MAG: leucine-rich repeat protein [Lachnospiraceae bacterium]|nr:leucine-rich repeat protein [Lachnospiraceae bacterium]
MFNYKKILSFLMIFIMMVTSCPDIYSVMAAEADDVQLYEESAESGEADETIAVEGVGETTAIDGVDETEIIDETVEVEGVDETVGNSDNSNESEYIDDSETYEKNTEAKTADELKDDDEPEEEALGDLPAGLIPVYSNSNYDTFTLNDSVVIGYAKLNAPASGRATYYCATGNSDDPSDVTTITVPRRLVMVRIYKNDEDLVGTQALLDYTKGYCLDPEGYAVEVQGGEERKQVVDHIDIVYYIDNTQVFKVIDKEADPVAGTPEECHYEYSDGTRVADSDVRKVNERENVVTKDLYIGTAYDVTDLDKDVFHFVDVPQGAELKTRVTTILLPAVIRSDITYDFFEGLKNMREVKVYDSGSYDRYYVDNTPIPEFDEGYSFVRYVAAGTDSKDKDDESAVFTSGALVDTWTNETGVVSKIVYCPPKYPAAVYNYFFGTQSGSKTIIGDYAFKDCVNLKTIRPVTPGVQVICRIGDHAFDGCVALEEASVFGTFLTQIGDYAFKDCESLKTVTFDSTVSTSLGVSVFANTSISKLEIPVGFNYMTGETFKDMTKLERIDVVEGSFSGDDDINQYYTSIDGVLYRYEVDGYITQLEEPDIDEGIQLVCYPSLCKTSAKCPDAGSTLKDEMSFSVPYQVTSFDEYCFYKCNEVQNMYFPSTILSVGLNRFYECKNLTNLYFYSGLPNFEVSSGNYATVDYFGGPKKYMYIYAGEGTPIYEYAGANFDKLKMQRVALYHPGDYSYIFNNDDTATLLEYKPSGSNDTIEHIVIPNYVESAGVRYTVTGVNRAAIVNKDIKSVYFLHDMRNVALDAFYNVRNRDDIDDERNINCTRLADIYVEPGNFNIGSEEGVLYSMAWDKEKQEYVPSELLYYPVGNTAEEFTTIDGISVLPEFAFWGAKNLKSVNIYDTVQDIGYSSGMGESQEYLCFEGCSNLVFVNIIHSDGQKAANIRYYSDNGVLYRWNPNVDTTGAPVTLVYYPKGKREMSEDGTSPVSYVVADGCREVRYVQDCPYLTGMVFPKSVTTIADQAFLGSTALSSIEFLSEGKGDGITTIGEEAFAYTDISSVSIPAGIVDIADRAFYGCNSIETIRIEGDKLKRIGEEAFSIARDDPLGISELTSVEIVCTLENETGGNLTIGNGAFKGNTYLNKLTITSMGKTQIGSSTFRDAWALKEINITNTDITSIGVRAFQSCKELQSLDLGDLKHVEQIPNYCFYNCNALEDIILPKNTEEIGEYAFKNCYALASVNFDELNSLKVIEDQAFANTGFIAVNLPPDLVTLGDSAFAWDSNKGTGLLSTIYVPASVTFSDGAGNYRLENGKGPFYDYGPETYVYGILGSDVDLYIQWMDQNGYKHPTFVGAEAMPGSQVDLRESVIEVYNVGDELPMLTAVVSSMDALQDYSVRWYVMDPIIAEVIDETFDGINTSTCKVRGKKLGSTRIYAINKQTGASDYCVVNVKNADIEVNPSDENKQNVNGLVLPKSIILNCKGTLTKTALNATSNPPRKIYYRSNNKRVVKVNRKGIVTGKKQGQTTITAYAGANDTYVEAQVEVTVFKPTISLDKKKVILNSQGGEEDMQAVVNVSHFGAFNDVEWVSSKPSVFTVEGDNERATIKAVPGCPGGKGYVFAYCNGIKAKCKVVVTKAGTSLNTTSILLYAGQTEVETYQLKATVTGKKKEVIWESLDPDIANVDQKGLVTAVAPGKALVTATCNGISATCTVNVIQSYIKLYGPNSGDASEEQKSIVINANGDNKVQLRARVVGRDDTVSWTSESVNTFTVDREGLLTGKSGGTANVLAKANGDTATCSVTVIDNYTRLDYSKITLYMSGSNADKMITLTAMINGADTTRAVTWEAEDGEILSKGATDTHATMTDSEYEGTSSCTFTALKEGTTRVKVTSNGVSAYCTVTVKK